MAMRTVLLLCTLLALGAAEPLPFTGVNLAGAEFNGKKLPGIHDQDYCYPKTASLEYFQSRGVNVIRLPFLWERLQPELYGEFQADEWRRLDDFLRAALERGMVVILDPHNYARYRGSLIGSKSVPIAAFEDFWRRLATAYADQERVWFGLMNEPHGIDATDWVIDANAAIAAIRATGAANRILVPGVAWSGAHSWSAAWYGTSNATALLAVVDPADNWAIEVHQYLDGNSSGSGPEVAAADVGVKRLATFTAWCRAHQRQAFLGEFAVAANDDPAWPGYPALEAMLQQMEQDRDVWLGYTWWAAGPWWGEYLFTLEPKNGEDRPQLRILRPHLQPIEKN
jgi:endoglucanase